MGFRSRGPTLKFDLNYVGSPERGAVTLQITQDLPLKQYHAFERRLIQLQKAPAVEDDNSPRGCDLEQMLKLAGYVQKQNTSPSPKKQKFNATSETVGPPA